MYDRKYFCLIVALCIGSLLCTTACSKYVSKSSIGNSNSDGAREDLVDVMSKLQIKNGDIAQDDLSKVDLLKVEDRKTPLCNAIDRGELDLLETYLERIKNNPKKYPYKKVIYLISGFIINTVETENPRKPKKLGKLEMPLLFRAITNKRLNMLNVLFETLQSYNFYDDYGLYLCDQAFSVRLPSGFTIIHQAVESGSLNILQYLIDSYIEIKKMLRISASAISCYLAEHLCIRREESNKQEVTPVSLAFMHYGEADLNYFKILVLLLAYTWPDYSMEYFSISKLHSLIESDNLRMVKNLIHVIEKVIAKNDSQYCEQRISTIVNQVDWKGHTLLYKAVNKQNIDAVEYLMKLGSRCTHFDNQRVSPLLIAIELKDLSMVKLLLDKKFPGNASLKLDVNLKGIGGLTPLNLASGAKSMVISQIVSRSLGKKSPNDLAKKGPQSNIQIVQALLNAGSKFSIPDESGKTPLHQAIIRQDYDLVKLLLEVGADPLAMDSAGNNPLGIVIERMPLKASVGKTKNESMMLDIIKTMVGKVFPDKDKVKISQDVESVYYLNNYGHSQDTWINGMRNLLVNEYGLPNQYIPGFSYKRSSSLLDIGLGAPKPKKPFTRFTGSSNRRPPQGTRRSASLP